MSNFSITLTRRLRLTLNGILLFIFRGRIKYYTEPPIEKDCHISSKIVEEMSREFDIKALENMEVEMMNELAVDADKGPITKLETAGMVEAMEHDQKQVSK